MLTVCYISVIKTYFIIEKKKDAAPGVSEGDCSPKTDTVAVNMDGDTTVALESDTLMNDTTAEVFYIDLVCFII